MAEETLVAGALVAGAFFILGMVALTVARGRLAALLGLEPFRYLDPTSSSGTIRCQGHSPFFTFFCSLLYRSSVSPDAWRSSFVPSFLRQSLPCSATSRCV
jgi:hypothetical protein